MNTIEKEIEVDTFEQAFKVIQNLRDQSGKFSEGGYPFIGRKGHHKNKRIGVESFDKTIRYRIDYKDGDGVHFNYEDFEKNVKYAIKIRKATKEDYVRYVNSLNAGMQHLDFRTRKFRPIKENKPFNPNAFYIRDQHPTYPSPFDETATREIKEEGKIKR